MGKLSGYFDRVRQIHEETGWGSRKIAKQIIEDDSLDINAEYFASKIRQHKVLPTSIVNESMHRNNLFPLNNWKVSWVKDKETGTSTLVENPDRNGELSREEVSSWINSIVEKVKPRELNTPKTDNKKAFRAIITDCHVGMNPQSEEAMFGFEYNEKVFKSHLDRFFSSVQKEIDFHGTFDTIFIDDLGDSLDAFKGETSRGGHKLPQNMSDKQAWRAYVENKLQTIVDIIKINGAGKYVFRNVVNDNHSSTWGWSANYAIKMVLERMYEGVDYLLLNRPAEHFEYGKHTFIMAHGKDEALMIKNWPLNITDKLSNFVRQYIDHYNIQSPYIHVDKGDLHRVAYDRDPKFDYRNFMSFAPPSTWIQANFGVSYCGYSTQVIPKNSNEIQHTDIFFDLKPK